MNKNAAKLKSYQATQVTTANPGKILLMLYEGCIKFIKIARVRMAEKNLAEKGKNISKAIAIISELISTLDHDKGGQLSIDLENLYMFMMDKLIEANVKNDPECLDAVERLLNTLYGAWTDVVNNPRADGVPSPALQPDLYEVYTKANGAAPKAAPASTRKS